MSDVLPGAASFLCIKIRRRCDYRCRLKPSSRTARGRTEAVRASFAGAAGTVVAKSIEPVGKGYQPIGPQCVVFHILDIVTCNRTAYAVALTQNIIDFQGNRGVFPFEELVGGLGIPQPTLGVVTRRVSCRTAVSDVGAQRDGPRQITAHVECAAVVVGTLVVLVLHAVGGQQVAIVSSQFGIEVVRPER